MALIPEASINSSPVELGAPGGAGQSIVTVALFFFFFFSQGRSCLTGDSARPQRKACETSVTPPKERARKGVPRTEQRARTQAETDGHSARNAEQQPHMKQSVLDSWPAHEPACVLQQAAERSPFGRPKPYGWPLWAPPTRPPHRRLQRPLQHLARVVRQGAASLWPPVGLTPAQASPPAPGALAPQRFVTREATMHDVAPASAPLPQPLPQPERQRCAASAAGTGSGDVAMAAAPAQQLRLPRRSAPRDSAMADAPPLRLPPPRAGPARAPPAGHPAAQPDFAMAEAAALSQPQLPAPGRLGPAVRVRTTAATRPARLPQLMPPASPSGQLPLRAQALPVPPPAAPAPAPPVPAARTRAPHATGATALPAAQRQRPQRRPPGPLVLPPPPPLPPPPALPGPPRMRAPQRRRAPPGPSSPAATDSGSERALRPSSPVRHRRAGDTASRRNPPRQRALHGPWYSCTGRPSSGAPARP